MSYTIPELMTASLNDVFGERDDIKRQSTASDIYAAEVVFSDPEGTVTGRDELIAKAKALLDSAPSFVFAAASPVYVSQDLGYLEWSFGPEGQPPVATGMDIATVQDGRIVTLHTLLTQPGIDD